MQISAAQLEDRSLVSIPCSLYLSSARSVELLLQALQPAAPATSSQLSKADTSLTPELLATVQPAPPPCPAPPSNPTPDTGAPAAVSEAAARALAAAATALHQLSPELQLALGLAWERGRQAGSPSASPWLPYVASLPLQAPCPWALPDHLLPAAIAAQLAGQPCQGTSPQPPAQPPACSTHSDPDLKGIPQHQRPVALTLQPQLLQAHQAAAQPALLPLASTQATLVTPPLAGTLLAPAAAPSPLTSLSLDDPPAGQRTGIGPCLASAAGLAAGSAAAAAPPHCLQGQWEVAVRAAKQEFECECQEAVAVVGRLLDISLADCMWARGMVASRALSSGSQVGFIPFIDLLNHSASARPPMLQLDDEDRVGALNAWLGLGLGLGAAAPWLVMTVTSMRDNELSPMSAGDELFINYCGGGDLTPLEAFLKWGFVPAELWPQPAGQGLADGCRAGNPPARTFGRG
ncbi:hypothetical protein QJQ45_016201 [Haematococcus lacustris]|nr:hypothetical protein QJQ45_016201 [Haematococcus lacustris]